jgi:hypothetical protein
MGQKLTEFMEIFIGTRKFIAWTLVLIVAIVFRVKDYVDGAQFVDLLKGTFLGFVTGNVLERINETAKTYITTNATSVGIPTSQSYTAPKPNQPSESADVEISG